MYLEFLLRRAHSRRRVDRRYWSGESLYSRTTCSNSVIVGVIGPIGSGLPQLGFPRRLAMKIMPRTWDKTANNELNSLDSVGGAEDSSSLYKRISNIRLPPCRPNDWKPMILGRLSRYVNENILLPVELYNSLLRKLII